MGNPYVISAELDLANTELERIVRSEGIGGFRESLDASLRDIGKNTVWVSSDAIQTGLEFAISKTKLPVVSLDDRYVTSADEYIGLSRGIDEQLNDIGYVPRVGYPPIEQQLGKVATLGSEIVIADDVLFSGGMISWLANALEPYGVRIGGFVCGIAIREGTDKMQAKGIDIEAVRAFDGIEDEICERDFAVVTGSGRRIDSIATNALYFDPTNGNPSKWASIPPERVEDFARSSYLRSAKLIKPELCFRDIGNFYGWDSSMNVVESLKKAAMWAYARARGVPPVFYVTRGANNA